jgi:hypothetical protein
MGLDSSCERSTACRVQQRLSLAAARQHHGVHEQATQHAQWYSSAGTKQSTGDATSGDALPACCSGSGWVGRPHRLAAARVRARQPLRSATGHSGCDSGHATPRPNVHKRMHVRGARMRWGSCSAQGGAGCLAGAGAGEKAAHDGTQAWRNKRQHAPRDKQGAEWSESDARCGSARRRAALASVTAVVAVVFIQLVQARHAVLLRACVCARVWAGTATAGRCVCAAAPQKHVPSLSGTAGLRVMCPGARDGGRQPSCQGRAAHLCKAPQAAKVRVIPRRPRAARVRAAGDLGRVVVWQHRVRRHLRARVLGGGHTNSCRQGRVCACV